MPNNSLPPYIQPLSEAIQTGIHLPTRSVFLTGPVDEAMVRTVFFAKQSLDRSGELLYVYLNSCGGSLIDGLAIYDMLRTCESEVVITGLGCCYSMATVIVQAGDQRLLTPNCDLLIHPATISELSGMTSLDLAAEAVAFERHADRISTLLADRIGITLKQFKNRFHRQAYLTAAEAVVLNLADKVTD